MNEEPKPQREPATAIGVACSYYYWKPMLALFRSVELAVFQRLKVQLPAPVLDLGCGEGRPIQMLQTLELAQRENTIGFDLSLDYLREARELRAHDRYVQGDAMRLPFVDAQFGSVVCNNVYGGVPEFSVRALEELRRVLRPGGVALVTVPTDRFTGLLPLKSLLDSISYRLGETYARKINERMPHVNALAPQAWEELFTQAGLEIVRIAPYFSPPVAALWNLFSFSPFRIFGLLRFARPLKPLATRLLERLISQTANRAANEPASHTHEFGYVCIVARRPG